LKRNAEPESQPKGKSRSNRQTVNSKDMLRIRMYRVGFGDCFLISITDKGKTRHILVDCGVHSGGDIGSMKGVIADIQSETSKEIELVIVTHAHRDHISGFSDYEDVFKNFKIGNVWLPWTEDPKDQMAQRLRDKHNALAAMLNTHFQAHTPSKGMKRTVAMALNSLNNLTGNQKALELLKRGINNGNVSYVEAGQKFIHIKSIPSLTVQIIAPPRDEAFLKRLDPPVAERFLSIGQSKVQARNTGAGPLSAKWQLSDGEVKLYPYYEAVYNKEKDRLAEAAIDAVEMAFSLSRIINNTSIVVLLTWKGKSLLFPGDAQYGSWQSWMKTRGSELSQIDFLKISHHGSENATPRSALGHLPKKAFIAVIPTENKPFPSIPHGGLLAELACRAQEVVRSDEIAVANAPAGPCRASLPNGFSRGSLWIDCFLYP